MDSTTNLASLPEESLEQEQEQRRHSHSQQQQQEDSHKTKPLPSSAFASVPDRPPMQSSSEKYSALDWMGYFDEERDVSIADADDVFHTMCNDVFAVVRAMYGDSPPAIVLVGHSMGGSVAVHVAAKKTLCGLAGLLVVDVVEGTAVASLIHMQKILSSRMQHFSSIEKAVKSIGKSSSF